MQIGNRNGKEGVEMPMLTMLYLDIAARKDGVSGRNGGVGTQSRSYSGAGGHRQPSSQQPRMPNSQRQEGE